MPLFIKLKDNDTYKKLYDHTDDRDIEGGVLLDYDKEGNVIGVEILSEIYQMTYEKDY